MFKFITYDIPECEQINSDTGRLYKTPNGDLYPSVTTVLGRISMPYIEEWKARLGKEEAKRQSDIAAKRGVRIHSWCEGHFLRREPIVPITRRDEFKMFLNMVPELNRLTVIHALEQRLWSDKLKVAGTVDCIGECDGVLYIVDFKTSRGIKNREDISSYFMQCAAYAVAWYERTGIAIANMRIIITTQDDGVLVYDEPVKRWVPEFMKLL